MAVTANDSEMSLYPPLVVETRNAPLYVPTTSPVFGRALTVAESIPPPGIVLTGCAVISKYAAPAIMLALMPVSCVVPVLVMVVDTAACVP